MLSSHEQLLDAIEDHSRSAREAALLLMGAVGSGKSTLLEAASRRDPEASVLVRINYAEAEWPLSGASAMLSAIGDSRATEFAGRFAVRDDVPLATAASELLIVLRGLRLPRTTLLVDDIDHMDPASRQLVGYLCGHLGGSGLRIIATAAAVSSREPLAGVPRLRVPALTDAEAEALAPRGVHSGTLRLLTWSSEGNLGAFVTHLASLTREQREGREPLRFPLPPGPAARAVHAQVQSTLGPRQIEVLERLAMCGIHGRDSIARWTDAAEDALQELLDRGIVTDSRGYVQLRDNLLRASVAAGLPTSRRRELHHELRTHADPLIAPWHAAFVEHPEKHRDALLRSAAVLAQRARPGAAVEFADRAVRLGRDGVDERLAELAEALLLSGEIELADRTLRHAAVEAKGDSAVTTMRARVDFVAGRPAPGFDALTPLTDPPTLALAARRAILAEDYAEARTLIAQLSSSLDSTSRVWSGWATALGIECAYREGQLNAAFELARDWDTAGRLGDGPGSFIPLTVWECLADGDLAGARARLRDWTSHALSRAGAVPAAMGLTVEAGLARLDGDIAHALERLLVADSVAASLDDPSLSRHLPELIEVLLESGREEPARGVLERFEEAAAHRPSRWATLALARARVALSRDDDAASAARRAHSLYTPFDSGLERGKLLRTIGWRLSVLGELDLAERAHADAQVAFASTGAVPWMARPTGTVLTPERPSAAIASINPSVGPPAALSEHPLLDALTADERAVVALVSRGLQNKEIAAQLFVSVRTVELRLTHIYRTVGARSRSHLVSLLH